MNHFPFLAAFAVFALSVPAVAADDERGQFRGEIVEKPADEKAAVKESAEEKAVEAQTETKPEAKAAGEKVAEEKKEQQKTQEQVSEGIKKHQEASQKVFEQTKKITEGLSPEEQKHFFILYNNYNMIGTVKMVQGDVGNAVKACGESNPDMKDKMDARFKTWNEAINPIVKESEGHVDNMVIAQEYAKPKEIKEIFKGLDETRVLANAQVEKTPVTTKEACEYLLNTMDDTQENFAKLLRSTLISAPAIVSKDKAEKAAPETDVKKDGQKAEDKPE